MKALEFFLTKDLNILEQEFRLQSLWTFVVHLLCAGSPIVNKTGNTLRVRVSITEV